MQRTVSANAEATSHDGAARERLILDYLRWFVPSHETSFATGRVRRPGAGRNDRVDPRRRSLRAGARREPRRVCTPTVAGEIQRHLRDAVPAMRPPRRLHELNGTLRRLRRELSDRLGRPASISELAEAAGTSTAEAGAASEELDTNPTVSIEDLPVAAGDPFDASDARLFVASCLDTLDERERRILELRFLRRPQPTRDRARDGHLADPRVTVDRAFVPPIQCRAAGWASFEDCGTTAKLIH